MAFLTDREIIPVPASKYNIQEPCGRLWRRSFSDVLLLLRLYENNSHDVTRLLGGMAPPKDLEDLLTHYMYDY